MADEWQIEAVKEQFKVIKESVNLYKNVDTNDVRAVHTLVSEVITSHLRVKKSNLTFQNNERHICGEIIKHSRDIVKFGFTIIVTNERVDGRLSKVPIFTITSNNEIFFIDMQCCVFKNWNAFLKNIGNILPHQCCFPVDGQYIDHNRLKVDFVTPSIIHRGWNLLLLGGISCLAVSFVAATFFFNVDFSSVLQTVDVLLPIAEQIFPALNKEVVGSIMKLLHEINNCKTEKKGILMACPLIFKELNSLHCHFKDEINTVVTEIKDTFKELWILLKTKLSPYFHSETFPFRLFGESLAITTNQAVLMGNQIENDFTNQTRIRLNVPHANHQCAISSTPSEIFKNCRNESFSHFEEEKKLDNPSYKKELVSMTANYVNSILTPQLQETENGLNDISQNDLTDILSAIKALVEDNYEQKLKLYYNCLSSSKHQIGSSFDINVYNKSIGIIGDPETHFLDESVKNMKKLLNVGLVTEKRILLQKQERIKLIQCIENTDKLFVFRFIGVGKGLISSKEFVKSLRKKINFDEDTLIEKEDILDKSVHITLLTSDLCIWIWQCVNENNDAEGFIFINKND